MFYYNIADHKLWHDTDLMSSDGYSGHGDGRNNPNMMNVAQVGPIPIGMYGIGPGYHHPRLGPLTFNLVPDEETITFGRSLFRIHGNNAINDASHGCIIQILKIREQIEYLRSTKDEHYLVVRK